MTDDVERYADALVWNPWAGFGAILGLFGAIAHRKKKEAKMMEQVLSVLEYVEVGGVKRWRAKPQELDLVLRANGNVDNVASVGSLTRQLQRNVLAHEAIAALLEQYEYKNAAQADEIRRVREQLTKSMGDRDQLRSALNEAHSKTEHAVRTANDVREEVERHIRHVRDANNEVERLRNVVKALTRRLGKMIGEAAAGGYDHG